MMMKPFLRKRPCPPAFHPSRRHSYPVNSASRVGYITADIFKALPTENLTPASYMVFTLETVPGGVVPAILGEWRPGDAQPRIFRELCHQKLQVFRIEGKVGIQVADYFELNHALYAL